MTVMEREALKAEVMKLFELLTYDEQIRIIELIKSCREAHQDRE